MSEFQGIIGMFLFAMEPLFIAGIVFVIVWLTIRVILCSIKET